MSYKEFRIACVGLTILFFITFEFVVQKIWIYSLEHQSKARVAECLEIKPTLDKELCFVKYVDDRNDKASKAVNNYAYLILFLIGVSGVRAFYVRRQKRGRYRDKC